MPSEASLPPRAVERVRKAVAQDLDVLSNLRTLFWQDQISKGLLDYHSIDKEDITKETGSILIRPRTSVLVSERDNVVTGYVYGQVRIVPAGQQSRVGRIEEIYVNPANSSVSSAFLLMRRILEYFKETSADRIQANVLENNQQGQQIAELLGFRVNLRIYEYDFSAESEAV